MENLYCLIVKTGEAEIRALENIPKKYISKVLPIIELTRGRKITRNNQALYPFDKRLDKFKTIFKGQDVCLDVTSDDSLSSPETRYLFDPQNGYKNWISFLDNLKEENVFNQIIPSILWNFNDSDFQNNIKRQIASLIDKFGIVAYRNPIEDENVYDDIIDFLSDIPTFFILDCGYVPQASYNNVAEKCMARLNNICSKSLFQHPDTQYILASTSYPNNVGMFGDFETDTLRLTEIDLYEAVRNKYPEVRYCDYGSINPIRNDAIIMSRGWIPKIDVSLERTVYYHRQRRPKGTSSYSGTYIQVANSCVMDTRFPSDTKEIWGLRQIQLCAEGSVPSSSPSYWISVRMNTHIQQQILNRFLS